MNDLADEIRGTPLRTRRFTVSSQPYGERMTKPKKLPPKQTGETSPTVDMFDE